jgi:hypothetical protein
MDNWKMSPITHFPPEHDPMQKGFQMMGQPPVRHSASSGPSQAAVPAYQKTARERKFTNICTQ